MRKRKDFCRQWGVALSRHELLLLFISGGQRKSMVQRDPDKRQEEERRDRRLAPEEVLDRYHLHDRDARMAPEAGTEPTQIQERKPGRLRIYLGAAAGVGKTYAMLNEG